MKHYILFNSILFFFTSFYINNIYTQTIIYPGIVLNAEKILVSKQKNEFNKQQKIKGKKINVINKTTEYSDVIDLYYYDRNGNEIKSYVINTYENDTITKTYYNYSQNNYILSKKYFFMDFKEDYKLDSHCPDTTQDKKIERLIETKYKYDYNYNLIEESEYNNGELCHKKLFTFDDEGRLTDEAIFGKDYTTRKIFASNSGCVSDTIYRHYFYGLNGYEVEMEGSKFGNTYEYSNSNKEIKITIIADKKDKKYEIVKLDDNKNIISKESFWNDTSKWINIFVYDENGNLIEDNFKYNADKIRNFENDVFNVSGIYLNKLYTYNPDGSCANILINGFVGVETTIKYVYYYDSKDILVEEQRFEDSDKPLITKYKYVFYDY